MDFHQHSESYNTPLETLQVVEHRQGVVEVLTAQPWNAQYLTFLNYPCLGNVLYVEDAVDPRTDIPSSSPATLTPGKPSSPVVKSIETN